MTATLEDRRQETVDWIEGLRLPFGTQVQILPTPQAPRTLVRARITLPVTDQETGQPGTLYADIDVEAKEGFEPAARKLISDRVVEIVSHEVQETTYTSTGEVLNPPTHDSATMHYQGVCGDRGMPRPTLLK